MVAGVGLVSVGGMRSLELTGEVDGKWGLEERVKGEGVGEEA